MVQSSMDQPGTCLHQHAKAKHKLLGVLQQWAPVRAAAPLGGVPGLSADLIFCFFCNGNTCMQQALPQRHLIFLS